MFSRMLHSEPGSLHQANSRSIGLSSFGSMAESHSTGFMTFMMHKKPSQGHRPAFGSAKRGSGADLEA